MSTCQASTVLCARPTASTSASLCAHHLALLASGRMRTLAEAEASLTSKTGRARVTASMANGAPWD